MRTIDYDELRQVITYVMQKLDYKPFLCLPLSALLYAILKDKYDVNVKIVTGDLLYNGKVIFKQDYNINNQIQGQEIVIDTWGGHCWVELNYEYILDLSLMRTVNSAEFTQSCKTEIIQKCNGRTGALIIPKTTNPTGLYYVIKSELSEEAVDAIIKGVLDSQYNTKA